MSLEQVFQQISQDPFARFMGIELLELREGYSKVTLTVAEHMLNFHGIPHGGVIFSLADAAFAAASLTDTLPLSLALTAGPTCPGYTCGYNAGSHAITWTGSLAAGASAAIIYTGWVSTVIGEGEPLFIANTAQVNDGASVPFTISAWVAVNPYLIYLPLIVSAWR